MMMRGGLQANPAEDLAQDTMLAVWRKARLCDPPMGSPAAWIYAIARNRRIDIARTTQRTPPRSADTGCELIDEQPVEASSGTAAWRSMTMDSIVQNSSKAMKCTPHAITGRVVEEVGSPNLLGLAGGLITLLARSAQLLPSNL
jgi:hypothetical protein